MVRSYLRYQYVRTMYTSLSYLVAISIESFAAPCMKFLSSKRGLFCGGISILESYLINFSRILNTLSLSSLSAFIVFSISSSLPDLSGFVSRIEYNDEFTYDKVLLFICTDVVHLSDCFLHTNSDFEKFIIGLQLCDDSLTALPVEVL